MTIMTNMDQPIYPKPDSASEWSVAQAKARFSELVAKARAGVPQRVTRYGKEEVVVVSAADWRARQEAADVPGHPDDRPGSLLELFAPLAGSGVVFERMPGGVREPLFGDDG